ncbi:GNAT family N-acetyltransferase [Nonomuraea sp. CA-218870]|uniref:GNAT family N-acetyltransferase n=1 Tax=Nonomuraea sp. CA-218870 TaxID=3239998 RepID=UPI003D9054CC
MHISEISADRPGLIDLQRAAYRIEAEIIGDDRIPPLHETSEELRAQPLIWLGAFDDDGTLLGAVAWQETAEEVDLDRLMVDPGAHRRGVGLALVKEVMARAGERGVVVSTGRDNTPARTLYERLGFTLTGEAEPVPGLWVVHYSS